MSVMYIGHDTYDNLIRTLSAWPFNGNGAPHDLCRYGFPIDTVSQHGIRPGNNPNNREYSGISRFMRLLAAYNWKAYRARYPRDCGEFVRYIPRQGRKVSIYQALKSLECIKYNTDGFECAELDRLIHALRSAIIDSLPEYGAASWG